MTASLVNVFVSSTWLDLQPERGAVEKALQRLRETKFVGMEYFGSWDEDTRTMSLDVVDRCQVYIGIFGGRYGSGITEAEYHRARELDLYCLIYFKDEDEIAPEWKEQDPPEKAARLVRLKKELRRVHSFSIFATAEDLATRVTADLHRWLFDEYLAPRLEKAAQGEFPHEEAQALLAAVRDLSALRQDLLAQLRERRYVIATRSTAPAPPAYFTGRHAELDALAQALTTGDTPQAITALQGMGGIGKTALAAQLAAQLNDAFPGGVFWADLPANGGDPLPVLAAWARLCGHDVSVLPDPQARAQAVRGILAGRVKEQGRLLVVLDDVRGYWLDGARALQSARPPGIPLLLTTREARVAQALRARITRLDTLPPDEARSLLTTLTDGALTGDDADRVAELCGCLPLALELAAAAAVEEGTAWLLTRLDDAATRLDALELDDARRKDESMRLTFDVSYQALAERHAEAARAFRCLGVFAPAPLSPARLAGVLAESDRSDVDSAQVEAADAHLRRLVRWALARREGECYSLHPLLRDYAAALPDEAGEGPAARAAHTTHYLAYAEAHDQPTAADYDALEAARPNVLAAMDRAYREQQWAQVRRFAWALCKPVSGYLGVRGYWGELRARLEQAVHAAEASNNQYDLTAFTGHRTNLLINTGNLTTARVEYQRILDLCRAQGNRKGEAIVLHQLGVLAQATGEVDKARRLYRQSLEIKEELGDQAGIAITLHELGRLAQATGEYDEAQRLYRQSLDIAEELGDRAGIASTLHQLGLLAQDTGEYDEAQRLYRQSLDINEELGNRAGMAQTLGELGRLARKEGNQAEAEKLYQQAMTILQEIGDVVNASIWMFNLAVLCEDQGRLGEALPLLERAAEIAERTGFREAERYRSGLERVRGKLGG